MLQMITCSSTIKA